MDIDHIASLDDKKIEWIKGLSGEFDSVMSFIASSMILNNIYHDAKKLYLSFTNAHLAGENNKNSWLPWFRVYIQNAFLYFMFLGPLALISWGSWYYLFVLKEDIITMLPRSIYALPLLIVSWFGNRNIRIRHRLFEELSHKERIMILYEGINKYIRENGSKKQKETLINLLLQTISENPSSLLINKKDLHKHGRLPSFFNVQNDDKDDTENDTSMMQRILNAINEMNPNKTKGAKTNSDKEE